jgi:4-hydroxybenzoate polyprenyltransferase
VLSAAMLGRTCLFLSVPALFILFSYSYAKRFTWLCHLYLGFAISLAPVGAWIAMTDRFSWPVALLSLALLTYIAGFDILYACQDTEFDRKHGLYSIPAKFGVKKAMAFSSIIHTASFAFLVSIYFAFEMGPVYLASVFLIGIFYCVEQRLVDPEDLSKIDMAFFHMNSLVSVTLLLGVFFDELI